MIDKDLFGPLTTQLFPMIDRFLRYYSMFSGKIKVTQENIDELRIKVENNEKVEINNYQDLLRYTCILDALYKQCINSVYEFTDDATQCVLVYPNRIKVIDRETVDLNYKFINKLIGNILLYSDKIVVMVMTTLVRLNMESCIQNIMPCKNFLIFGQKHHSILMNSEWRKRKGGV